MESSGCFSTNSAVRSIYVAKNIALVDLIHVVGTGFHVAWDKKVIMYLFLSLHVRYFLCVHDVCCFLGGGGVRVNVPNLF